MDELRTFLNGRSVTVSKAGKFIWSPDLDVFWEPMTHDEVEVYLQLIRDFGHHNCNN